ncbi:MAG: signal peptidase II [Myxococcales bacterium]|nr:signal peptidase II [Myxococcales bacterium]MCB9713793.1 signal peptidase II [Myxococcales bacterium]
MDSARPSGSGRRVALWFLVFTAFSSGCDLGTKAWAQHALGEPGSSISVVEPWLEFSLAYNRGTAFSVIPHLGQMRWLFALLAVGVVAMLFTIAMRRRPRIRELLALGLIAGGAIGNGYDRAFRLTPAGDTAVIDFIRVNITPTYSWPTFNVADAWLLIGVAWLLWMGLRRAPDEPAATATTAATAARS